VDEGGRERERERGRSVGGREGRRMTLLSTSCMP
jgi:hypothetical protein